jgi:molecular chaperone DnaK (HSP70)
MSEPLGLSIGTTSMVAARVGSPPVTRRSVLTVSGQPLGGFVERAGDPIPLVAADGSRHLADDLIVAVLDEMAGDTGGQERSDPGNHSAPIAIAVPAHWNGATLRALRSAMRSRPNLAPGGVPARLVSDAVTTLTALHASPGLPTSGVVALMDFGGGGTTVTLADAASSFETIETRRIRTSPAIRSTRR